MAHMHTGVMSKPRTVSPITDSFNRANSTTTLGNADTGQAWSALVGTWGINTNTAYNVSATDGDTAAINFGQPDMVVEVTFSTFVTNMGLIARATDSNNYYLFDCATNNSILYKKVAGSFTSLGSFAFSFTSGTVIKLSTQGTTIKAFINGVERISATDSALATGNNAGLRKGLATGGARFDTFSVTAT